MTEFASLPPVTSDGLQPIVAAVAKAVADRADRLVDVLGEAIIRKSDPSGVTLIQPHDDIRDAACRANIRTILAAMVNKTEFARPRQRKSASNGPTPRQPYHR
jgi:hypothetical protein